MTASFFPRAWWIGLLAGLTLIGAWLRWPALFGDLWMDEIWSFQLAHAEPSALGLFIRQTWANNHLLNTLWLRGLGESTPEFWFRLPSFLCGTLSIPVAAWTLSRWGAGRAVRLLGATLVAVSFFQIQYSTEARGYAGAFLCALLALGLRFSTGTSPAGWLRIFGFGLVQTLGMLWHPGYVLFVAGLAVAQLVTVVLSEKERRAREFGDLVRWQVLPGAVLLTYQILFLSKLRYGAAGYQEPVRPMMEAAGWTLNLVGFAWGGPLAAALLAVGFALGIRQILRSQRELAVALVLSCALLPAALVFLHPPRVTGNPLLLVLFPRYFHLPFSVALLAVAWGLGGLQRGRLAAMFGLPALLSAGLLVLLPPLHRFGRIGSRQVLEHLASQKDGLVRIGTNELTRGKIQFGFYARRLGLQDRFVWIEQEYWLITPPDYMISLAPGALPNPILPPSIRGNDQTVSYEMDQVFPYGGAAGFNCVVFRRKWSAPDGTP